MPLLPETQQALTELGSNFRRGGGIHSTGTMEVGSQGLYVGSEDYRPGVHSPHDIDHLSPFELVYGQDQVSLVIPDKPLAMNIVIDATERREDPAVSGLKTSLAEALHEAMDDALPGMNDRVYSYVISDGQRQLDLPTDYETIEVADAASAEQEVAAMAAHGLTVVISDFRRWRGQESASSNSLENVIAIKANHPAERYIPANIGIVSLGGWQKINTGKKRQLSQVNEGLEREHLTIVNSLFNKNAKVASVIAVPKQVEGFDVDKVDQAIAEAILN